MASTVADVSSITRAAAADSAKPVDLVDEPSNGLSADFETFLKLLTTQLQSQDPLQPMESTEFVAQLAQFSSVEQQVQTNEKLDTLLESLSANNAGALADWLGREVRAPVRAPYDGAPIEVYPPAPESEATAAALVVRDADGKQVVELPFKPGETRLTWDGKTTDGGEAPEGLYRFEARFSDAKGVVETQDASVFAKVVEARAGDDGPVLVFASGDEVAADEVGAVRMGTAERAAATTPAAVAAAAERQAEPQPAPAFWPGARRGAAGRVPATAPDA